VRLVKFVQPQPIVNDEIYRNYQETRPIHEQKQQQPPEIVACECKEMRLSLFHPDDVKDLIQKPIQL